MSGLTKFFRCALFGLGVFMLALGLSNPVSASDEDTGDWPKWRGKKQDGIAHQRDVFNFDQGYGLKIAWKKDLGGGYSSISIAAGQAVTMFSDSTYDYIISLNAETGKENWRYTIDETYDADPNSNDGPLSTPVIDADRVFVLAPKGQLLSVNLESGRKQWSHDIVEEYKAAVPQYGFTTAPLVYGDLLIVQTGGTEENTISAFNKNTGELLWATGTDSINYQSPISVDVLGQSQLFCVGDNHVYGLDPQTGNVLWGYSHNGGNTSINPVMVAENQFLINPNGRESVLVKIQKQGNEFKAEEVWKSTKLKQSLNTPVYYDGYLYGYDARFVTCVDARTGEAVWKSRPPGDGFLIVVDGHLVILTRTGTLHVSKASPEGYNELASLRVFPENRRAWTPPSFAYGRIYVRDFFDISSIEIAPVDQMTLPEPDVQQVNPTGAFAAFVKEAEAAPESEREKIVAEFVEAQKSFPIIEDDRFAHIVYYGEHKDLAVSADFFNSGQEVPMNAISGTDFAYLSAELEPDAHVEYYIRKDFDNVITDPRNPHSVPSFTSPSQVASELAMPEWKRPTHFEEPAAKGTFETFEFASEALGNTRNVHVYLPSGYSENASRYPVVYVNYGQFAKDMALVHYTMENLAAADKIRKAIVIYVEAPQSGQEYARNFRDQHAQMFTEELIPFIDDKYRTEANPDSRLVMGGDEGGFAAFYAAFTHPGVIGNVAGQSTHMHQPAGGDSLTALIRESEKQPIRMYMDWGKYDLLYANGLSWVQLNEEFIALLEEKGYEVVGGQVNEGFGFGSWRNRNDKILITFFPKE